MKQFFIIPLIGFSLTWSYNASAQVPKKVVITNYKYEFLYFCTEAFAIDTGWRDDVCAWIIEAQSSLDKRSYVEIDSMSSVVEALIWKDFDATTGHPRYPNSLVARECAIKHCLDQYESKDLEKLAKRAAKRVRKMTLEEIFMSHR